MTSPLVRPQTGWHYRRSLASRVILLTTIAVAVAVALVALAVFLTVRIQMQASLDDSLLDRAKKAARAGVLPITAEDRLPSWAFGAADIRIAFMTSSGDISTVDEGPGIRLGQPELDVAAGKRDQSIRTISAGDVRYRVATVPTDEDGLALVLAQSLSPQETVLKRLGAVMLLFGVAGVIGAAAAGWAVARNGLRPVRRLTTAVENIARTEELSPLPVEGDDEIARLATSFNGMLAALAASRDRQRRLVADAGHELRTPLTSLRTNLDLLTQADTAGGLPPGQREELLDDVRRQLEELSTLVGDLVELARDEPLTHVVETFDLAEVVDRAVSRVRLRAPRTAFDVVTLPWWVVGESGAVERAVTNLLDNAAKWGPDGSTVTVRLANGVLTVDDQGPGIDPGDLPHVFERFYRSRESRSMPGSGARPRDRAAGGRPPLRSDPGRSRPRGRRAHDDVAAGWTGASGCSRAGRRTDGTCRRGKHPWGWEIRFSGDLASKQGALPTMRRRRRPPQTAPSVHCGSVPRLAILLAAGVLALAGCSGDTSGPSRTPAAVATTDSVASHTPTRLKHPCDVVTGTSASSILGDQVKARKVRNRLAARTLECRYGRTLDITSTPDPRSITLIIGLYIGVDRLQHHPVDVSGSDGAAVVLVPGDRPSLTLFAKQGFVTHTVVVAGDDLGRAEKIALEVATELVAGNA